MFSAILHIVKSRTQSTVKSPNTTKKNHGIVQSCQIHIKVIKKAANCAVVAGIETTHGSLYLQDRRMILFYFLFFIFFLQW
jgi:hypothetical protein